MLCIVVILVILVRIAILRKRKKRSQNSEEIRKMHLSQGSLSHNEDDKNPDLIPQSTGRVIQISNNKRLGQCKAVLIFQN